MINERRFYFVSFHRILFSATCYIRTPVFHKETKASGGNLSYHRCMKLNAPDSMVEERGKNTAALRLAARNTNLEYKSRKC